MLAWLGAAATERAWIAPAITTVGAVGAAFAFSQPTAVRLVLGAVALVVGALPEIAGAWWRSQEESGGADAVVEAQVLIRQSLTPLAEMTALMAQRADDREVLFAKACQHATASCLMPFKDRQDLRALVFAVDDGGRTMSTIAQSGRLGHSEGFDRSTTRGRLAFKVLEDSVTVHIVDLDEAREERSQAWAGSGQGYRSFVTVPIAVGTRGYGLLTVDTPQAYAFGRTDILFVELVASMLGGLFAERASDLGR